MTGSCGRSLTASGATVVFVDYVNAPEAKYPTQQEQAYASLLYLVQHADELRVAPSRLAIMGDSVGGHMAAIVTLMAKQRGGPKIRFQVLFYPVTDYISDNDSYRTFANGPWIHDFAMLNPLANTPATRAAIQQAVDALKAAIA